MSADREPLLERLPYEAPVLRTIDLLVEEVMAVGCKLPSGGGPTGGPSCLVPMCFENGS